MSDRILAEDVSVIKELMQQVLHTDQYTELTRLGGLTNHTYKVALANGEAYTIRIPGEGTEDMIVRSDEMISTELACRLGVDAELLYFGQNGTKVTRFIPNAVTMSAAMLQESKHIEQVAEIFRTLHNCGVDTAVPFEVFDMAGSYEKIIIDKEVPMFDDYDACKAEVMRIKAEIDASVAVRKVPCHNDPLCENWVEGNGRMYLIDWEYAGMNDGIWDLADVSIEAGYDEDCDRMLLRAYIGKEPTPAEMKHFLASKIYVDFLWTLWAKARVPYDGQPMEDWAVERYNRMKGFIKAYKNY
jgi:thiamine kinase-like enzyme